uniref:right-handed parallel beta-helix repeat-containing protein n=1 Tax=uncultured Treponema sp. TaxID=162155 RepID=UPI0034D96035
TSAKYDGNPVTVPLPLNGGNEKQYKLEYYTDGTGFVSTERKTVYYKVVEASTVTYRVEIVDGEAGGTIETGSSGQKTSGTVSVAHGNSVTFTGQPTTGDWKVAGWTVSPGSFASPPGTSTTATLSNVTAATTVTVKFYQSTLKNPAKWRDLARAVKSAPDNATLTIDGEIKATDAVGDKGIINIKKGKKLTIKGNGSSAVLNADGKDGIFDVSDILTLKDITLKKGATSSTHAGGAGVYVNPSGTLIMKGSSAITGCSGNYGGGVYVSGTFEMHDTSKITDCTAKKSGGGIYVSRGTCTLQGSGSITSCKAKDYGGAIYASGATVNITNGTFKGNEAVNGGGAIYAQKEGSTATTVTINGGTIGGDTDAEKNKVTSKWQFGGGILVENYCTLTLNSVRIIGNEAWRAGGVRANRSTVTMTDCTIKNNKTTGDNDSGGGGVYTFMGTLTMTGCTITGNEAATNGGGLNVEGTTTNITNCTFTGNTAKNGGGIYTKKEEGTSPTVTISGGTIGGTGTDKANKATGTGSDGNGGGIYIGEDCKVTLQNNGSTGCTITGNTAQRGSGVYVNGDTFTMSGNAKIAVDNDVYLKTGKTITVDGTLSNNPAARITPESYRATTVLKGAITTGSPQNYTKFTVTPDGSPMTWSIDSSGTLTVTVADATQLYNAIQSARDGIPLVITITQGFPITESTESLKIRNGRDITVKDNGTRITLDCKYRSQDKHKFFCVESGGKLTLQGEITLKGAFYGDKEQYALYVEKFGTAEIKNTVEITGFLNNGYGCVYIMGTLTMSGGKIAGNKARWGGGVYIESVGIFEMKGGSIESNQAENLGRAMFISGTFNWTGGTITGHGGAFNDILYNPGGGHINNNTNPHQEPS